MDVFPVFFCYSPALFCFFIIESWTLYVFGTLILFSRFAVRFKTVGWRGLQGDGFFSVLVLIFYAVDAFTVHLISLTQDEIHEYETGSKLELAAWVVPDPGVLNVLCVKPTHSINPSNSPKPTLSSSEFQCLSSGNSKSPSASPSTLPSPEPI
ncbi:uncharacterized protein FFMR_10476 [Fusarium fujikuroi]|nr:uncharacterized protein FFMR_10476 [Fusarium fujikuroi]